jgi:hypothetical protein
MIGPFDPQKSCNWWSGSATKVGGRQTTFLRHGAAVTASRMRGPVALLATDATLYSVACAYMALGGATRKIEVFREVTEAERWLDHHTPSAR